MNPKKPLEYPIDEVYPSVYRDQHGEENTTIHNDGQRLDMVVRGVQFVGKQFDDFEAVKGTDLAALSVFTLNRFEKDAEELCDCEIEWDMPIALVINEQTETALLHTRMRLGDSAERGWLSYEEFIFTLHHAGSDYSVCEEWFEDGLLRIQALLPDGVYMKACINCAYSDYSPYGHRTFGDMECYRDSKEKYAKAHTKRDLIQLAVTERVQETYLCPEFTRRKPGTGYRG